MLCGELIDRMLENKSLHECKAPPPPARRVHLWYIFLALPVKNGPLPAELKFGENIAMFNDHYSAGLMQQCCKTKSCMFFVARFSVPLAELKPEPCQQHHRTGLDRRHLWFGICCAQSKTV